MQTSGIAILMASIAIGAALQASGAGAQPMAIEPYLSQSPIDHLGDAIRQVGEIAGAKLAASDEIAQARAAFYAELDQGILGSPEEAAFADLLHAEDLYFLSLNVSEGVFASTRRNKGINDLTGMITGSTDLEKKPGDDPWDLVGGKPLADEDMDGGIAQVNAFSGWVDAVRRNLGATQDGQMLFVVDPVRYQAAVEASAAAYDNYRAQRDKAEFDRWREQRPKIVVPPLDDPEARVDTYLTAIRPMIEEIGVPPAAIDGWMPRMRKLLLEDEKATVTPEIIPEFLRSKGFSAEDIRYWQTTYEDFKARPDYNPVWTPLDALCETQVMRDRRDTGAQNPNCRDEGWLQDIKRWLAGPVQEQEHALDLEIGLRNAANYATASLAMEDGHFAYEPPLPKFRRYDPAAAALAPPPVPAPQASPEVASAPASEASPTPEAAPAPDATASLPPPVPPPASLPTFDPARVLSGTRQIAWGVMPGDELDEADRIVRKGMRVAAVLDNDPAAWGYTKQLLTARVYVAEQDASSLTLMWLTDDPQQRIVAIARRLAMPGPERPPEQVADMLTGEFGPPTDGSGPTDTWHQWNATGGEPPPQCNRLIRIGLGAGFRISSGTLPAPVAGDGWQDDPSSFVRDTVMAGDLQYPDRLAGLAECPAMVWSDYSFGTPHPSLSTGVVDPSLAVRLSASPRPADTADLSQMLKGSQ